MDHGCLVQPDIFENFGVGQVINYLPPFAFTTAVRFRPDSVADGLSCSNF
jgi:hypothetical protein